MKSLKLLRVRWPFYFAQDAWPELMNTTQIRESSGRIINVTGPAEYVPTPRTGGRIVKAMPRQLRKIKEGQEREV